MKALKLKTKTTDVRSAKDGDDVVSEKDGGSVSAMDGECEGSVKDGESSESGSVKDDGRAITRVRSLLRRMRSLSRERREGRGENRGQSDRSGRCESRESRDTSLESTYEVEMASGSDTSSRSPRVVLERLPKTYGKLVSETSRLERKRTMSESSNDDSHPQTKVSTTSRGRGRPLTTGEYVGLAKAKKALLDLEQEELRLQAEKEVAEMAKEHRTRARSLSLLSVPDTEQDEKTAAALCEQVQKSVELILHVAAKSANLKGTFVRGLKEAASSIKGAVSKLSLRTASEENSRLEAENAKLKSELASFRTQLEEIRQEQANMRRLSEEGRSNTGFDKGLPADRSPRPRATNQQGRTLTDEDMREIMVQVGTMFNAKWEAVEQRLPPAPRVRPPLAADRASVVETPELSAQDWPTLRPKAPVLSKSGPSQKDSEKKGPEKGKRKRKGKAKAKASTKNTEKEKEVDAPSTSDRTPAASQPAEGEWVKVVKKGKRRTPKAAKPNSGKAATKDKLKVRTPRSSAVVLTLQPEGERKGFTYAGILTAAKSKIDLPTLGISGGLKIRSSVTGARIIEVPGATSSSQADSLAESLKKAFGEDEVTVSRPTKCAELRVVDLDETATPGDVVAAISKETGCPTDSIKTGDIRRSKSGLGTLWLRCPVADAKKVASKGKILVGWVSARVKMLEPRSLRCYRCHDGGHVKCRCTSAIDRSDNCYRCGLAGHKAALCSAAPSCSLCLAAGRPAGHIVGSKACTLPPGKKKINGQPKAVRVPPVEEMDEEVEVVVPGPSSSRGKGGAA